jgi:hypothetical protein
VIYASNRCSPLSVWIRSLVAGGGDAVDLKQLSGEDTARVRSGQAKCWVPRLAFRASGVDVWGASLHHPQQTIH